MAKLYRIVPDTISTVITSGYLSNTIEDLLYKLNYIGIPNERYFGVYQKGIVNESNSNTMFFFVSPWSCIMAIRFLNDRYSKKVARIFEYDIPDDIVNISDDAFTNYENWQAKGKLISLELLKKNKDVFNQFDDKLQKDLEKVSLHDANESAVILSENYSQHSFDSINQSLTSRLQKINKRRLEQSVQFFKSNIITGKSMIITGIDALKVFDVMFGEKTEEVLLDIMRKSNGILTQENFGDFDFDRPIHQYGPML